MRGCFLINNDKDIQVNEKIFEKTVRVIDENGQQLGLMNTVSAIQLAISKNLDLVKVAPLANPPVCRIMNYGKFKFDQSKRLKESKKNQKTMAIKEIRISLNINDHDLNTKMKNAIKFLTAGNKVKISIKFKGREMLRMSSANDIIEKIRQLCANYGTIDKPGKLEGRNMTAMLVPRMQK